MIEPTKLSTRDAIDEAVMAVLIRPGRSGLTILGTLLGVAAFVAVLGLTSTASGQISKRFTALSATEVTVEDAAQDPATADPPFPVDVEERLTQLNGVKAAGVYWQPKLGKSGSSVTVSAHPPSVDGHDGVPLSVIAASPGYLTAIHAHVGAGRLFDAYHQRAASNICLLGRTAAVQLGISRLEYQPAIFIGNVPLTVIGVVDDVDRQPEALLSIIVPSNTVTKVWDEPRTSDQVVKVLIETRLGAAQLIGRQAAVAIRPDEPDRFKVDVPPDPRQLKDQVNTDLGTLFLALATICLIIGAIGIANTTLVAVLERTGEIGLRRSLGARRRHIASQFLAESAALGLLGGLIGTSIGVLCVVSTAAARNWTPILDPSTVIPAPAVGAVIGLVAGVYPAWRATRIEPVEALRR